MGIGKAVKSLRTLMVQTYTPFFSQFYFFTIEIKERNSCSLYSQVTHQHLQSIFMYTFLLYTHLVSQAWHFTSAKQLRESKQLLKGQ